MQQKQRNNLKARRSIDVPHMVTIISQILPKKKNTKYFRDCQKGH